MTIEIEVGPRISNTGPTHTTEGGLIACVDWFSCTFHKFKELKEVCDVLDMGDHEFKLMEKGFNGYQKSASCGNILILYDPPKNTYNMGCHLSISGAGCREYEKRFEADKNWSTFMAKCLKHDIKFTRLDIAIDDFIGYLSLKTIMQKVRKGHVTSRFRTARNLEEHVLIDGSTRGQTIYFGKGDIMFRFYDKYRERVNKGYSIKQEIDLWNRYEIQLRGFKAMEACKVLAYNAYGTGELAKGLFANYLNFRTPTKSDTNKSRWPICRWWTRFLGDCEKVKLSQVPPELSVLRTKSWLDHQVATSLAMVFEAFGDDPLVLKYLVTLGKNRMDIQKMELIEDFLHDDSMQSLLKKDMQEYVLTQSKKNRKK